MSFNKDDYEILLYFDFYILLVDKLIQQLTFLIYVFFPHFSLFKFFFMCFSKKNHIFKDKDKIKGK